MDAQDTTQPLKAVRLSELVTVLDRELMRGRVTSLPQKISLMKAVGLQNLPEIEQWMISAATEFRSVAQALVAAGRAAEASGSSLDEVILDVQDLRSSAQMRSELATAHQQNEALQQEITALRRQQMVVSLDLMAVREVLEEPQAPTAVAEVAQHVAELVVSPTFTGDRDNIEPGDEDHEQRYARPLCA